MNDMRNGIRLAFALVIAGGATDASAQTATVTLSSQKQSIRGFGGMSHAAWAGDLTAAERTLAFGNADGQLGFSALRIPVSDGSPDSLNVATAKAAIANGAIVFATPWNASGAMQDSDFASYATHLNGFVTYMQGQGVNLYAIGVQNEPDYGSQGGWRTWTAAQCHDFILQYGATIMTKLMSCESYSYAKSYYDPILDDSAALANVAVLGTHLYGTPVSSYPYPLFDSNGTGKERWMTEHYTDSTTDANSWPNALGVATEMHHAMVDGQFNLYTWWYIVRSYGPIYTDGTVSKRGWCMAQFSKLIRPGFVRVDATATPVSGVYLSAYKSATDVVVVAVNTNASSEPLTIAIDGSDIASYTRYTTSASKSFTNDGAVAATNGSLTITLDPQSVTSLDGTSAAVSTGSSSSSGTSSSGGSSESSQSSVPGSSSAATSSSAAGTGSVSSASSRLSSGTFESGGTSGSAASTASGGGRTSGASQASASVSSAGTSSTAAGTGDQADSASTGSNGGCRCSMVRPRAATGSFAFLGMLGLASIRRVRRRRTPRAVDR